MSHRVALTVAQRESIYREKLDGCSINELAQKYHCSKSCARFWWRMGRDHGVDGLHQNRGARLGPGVLSSFDPIIADHTLLLTRLPPKRGATRILHDLNLAPEMLGHTLPKRSSLANFFYQACPELLHSYKQQPSPPPRARHVHELWQMDGKEHVALQDGTVATVLDIREPVACIFLGSLAHAVQTEKHWRKLTLCETQTDLRAVFTEFGLPVGVQTDRENLYGRPAAEAFPTLFTLWLVGLGIHHHFSRPHQPTDQPQVERGHRTLFDWMAQPDPIANLVALHTDLDTARYKHCGLALPRGRLSGQDSLASASRSFTSATSLSSEPRIELVLASTRGSISESVHLAIQSIGGRTDCDSRLSIWRRRNPSRQDHRRLFRSQVSRICFQ
jgi:hypothetical protein